MKSPIASWKPSLAPLQIEIRLLVVGPLVVIVAKLVVDGHEVVGIDLGAHLDAQVVLVVEVPGRGVADHFAVARAGDLRALPEAGRKRREAKRGVEALAGLHHLAPAS